MKTFLNGVQVEKLETQQYNNKVDTFVFCFDRYVNGLDLGNLTPRIVFDGVLTAVLGVDSRITREVTSDEVKITFVVPDVVTQYSGYGRGQVSFYDANKAKYAQVFAFLVNPSIAIAGWEPENIDYWDEYQTTIVNAGNTAVAAKNAAETAKTAAQTAQANTEATATQAQTDIALAKSGALTDISNAKSGAVTEVNTTKTNAVSAVNDAKTAAVTAVQGAQTTGVNAVNSATTTGTAQIQAKTEEQLARIPEVTQLASQVTVLNAEISSLGFSVVDGCLCTTYHSIL